MRRRPLAASQQCILGDEGCAKMAFGGLPSRTRRLLVMGQWGWGGGGGVLGGQQAVAAWRSLRSELLGGAPAISGVQVRGVQARAALTHLGVQLCWTLKVDAVEDLKRGQRNTHMRTHTHTHGIKIKCLTRSENPTSSRCGSGCTKKLTAGLKHQPATIIRQSQ